MSAWNPADVVRIIEFRAAGPDEPAKVFAEAAEWLADNSPVALVGVCLLYDGHGGGYGLQLAHTVDDDEADAPDCTCLSYVVDMSDPDRYHPENIDQELTPGCPEHDPGGGTGGAR